ncbi:MAG TPA: hypothetical protein VFM53_00055 [Anaeromyxobacteraceae bacterium]|nr:hypothetical protein [Anaeromyxobacteraceae bacterium]
MARILLFALDELRRRHAGSATPGADPRHDGAPFRAFRDALLARAAAAATGPAALTMWWEGSFDAYSLAVCCEPAGALAALDPSPACPLEEERVAPPRADGYPLARVVPGRAEVARDPGGGTWEAPFGAATGHFAAPGMRRIG